MPGRSRRITAVLVLTAVAGCAPAPDPQPPPTRLGLNLFGMQTFNRQPVFANLIAQSEWFASTGSGWTLMADARLDPSGWIIRLAPGETAHRPLALPPPNARVTVRCSFAGEGTFSVGGIAQARTSERNAFSFDLASDGGGDQGAWITLERTDPQDPVRDVDCRDVRTPRAERFAPELLTFLQGFDTLRFMDWQRVNDNAAVDWADRATPNHSSQVTHRGMSVEDMVDLANLTGADPWFVMPYKADAAYVEGFARLVHARIHSRAVVHVEVGNEIWNEMFDAARQAEREGMALGLAPGDPVKARMRRYAQKARVALGIWTKIFADRPGKLVRIVSTQNVWPDLSEWVLEDQATASVVDALATAPYLWVDAKEIADPDAAFAAMPAAMDAAIAGARANRAVARRHGKRFIAYEGGQHLVIADLPLATRIQRDPRMGAVYRRYLQRWAAEVGDQMMLYASTAPIGDYGAWGLREYAGQPARETPKLTAVRAFMKTLR